MRRSVFSGFLAAFLAFGAAAPALAVDYYGPPRLDRILPGIRARHPGKFYDAEGPFRGPDGQYRYRLKWMTPGGRIVWFDADARTGRVLGPDMDMRVAPRIESPFAGPPRDIPYEQRHWYRGGRWPREDYPRGHRR